MTDDIPDYSNFKDEKIAPGANLIGALTNLADQHQAAEAEVERLTLLLSEATANLRRISENDIPTLMEGLEGQFTLPDGRVVTTKEKIRSSATGDRKEAAINWLDENGQGAMVKRRFIIEFGRDQEDFVKKFERDLAKRKVPLNIKREKSIHHSTLEAFIRERLENGAELPLDTFGVFRQRFATVK